MRFGVLGTGPRARTVHAAALAAHPDAELVGVWGRDAQQAAAVGAEYEVPGTADLDGLLAGCDAVAVAVPPDVQVGLAVRAAEGGKHLLLEQPLALTAAGADRVVDAVAAAGVASVVLFPDRFRTATATWLREAGRAPLHGGSVSWLGSPAGNRSDDSAPRHDQGALWEIGSQALALLVPALGPVVAVQAGAGSGDTVHLVLHHEGGVASTVTVSSTVTPMSAGTETFVHGEAGRLVLLPDGSVAPLDACATAISDLMAAALTGGAHPCDAGFARAVTVVLVAAQRALASGCREPVAS